VLEHDERQLTAEERAKLAARLARGVSAPDLAHMVYRLAGWLVLLIVGVLAFGGLGRWIGFSGDGPGWLAALAGLVATVPTIVCLIVCGIGALSAIIEYQVATFGKTRFDQTHAPVLRQALEDGRASVCRISAVGVIVIDMRHLDGFNSSVIYDLGDGTSFSMSEEDCDADVQSLINRLPRQFEIVRTAAHGLWLGLANCEGTLEPELRICDGQILYDRELPRSESVVPGGPREVLESWRYEEDSRGAGC
jgi:hypothetical protein